MGNRLAASTSPYLLQHADNPVDWWEWGDEALAEARRRDVPVLLSVGYAACHWCHVMAHESFEDPATAALMNERFVCIKVDREERPDVDAVYMEATQAMTGHGGWPMTVFATPEGEPFFCGTYFPPRPMHRMPSFQQVLSSVGQAWETRRAELRSSAASILQQLGERSVVAGGTQPPGEPELAAAVEALAADFDAARGGFGGAPKFPPSMVLEFLLRHSARVGDARALALAEGTLEAMARGGIYDQLAGGFARYSVDAEWVVPHFEKMLYDNALLLRVYLHWWRLTGSPLGRRVAEQTGDFLLAELRTPEGGFASSLDADSEGEEGRFYVWTRDQLSSVLGDDDGDWAADLLGVTPQGTFEHGTSVLQLLEDPADDERWASVRTRLLAARAERVRPGRDDKVVAGWNGLAVAALAEAGILLQRSDFVEAAGAAAELVIGLQSRGGRLLRTSRDGVAGTSAGVLEDYADLAEGLLALLAATGDARWLEAAAELLDTAVELFAADDGGFYDAPPDSGLVRRPRDPLDGPAPSGQFALAGALATYAAVTGRTQAREVAERALGVATLVAGRYPRAGGWGLAVGEALLAGPLEIAVVGEPADPRTVELHRAALAATSPGVAVVRGAPGDDRVPLLQDRPLVDGEPAAYVCEGFACRRPVTSPAELRRLLDELGAHPSAVGEPPSDRVVIE
ncbi:hypothetical protein CLV35_0153 [Motilibacter peucedani]|uniref:Spermatogenesis-associated protein 20-like TRX domain-containing protein n=1 Tax=Motilibacter peucedani TaxID=598650 RepID=A0A420XV86_9ACTN|nr:thioredoxin domain-containing protein [Motilibacter peucedani]RKS80687.1 hypothetical protein CLV35_0153 [Motilibacter peucedani]